MKKIKYYDINKIVLYLCFIAIGFDGFYFYAFSFAIKPYMLIIFLGILLMIKDRRVSQLNQTERLMLLFFGGYGLLCIRVKNLDKGGRYIAGIIVMFLLYFSLREILRRYSIREIEDTIENCGIVISLCSIGLYLWGLKTIGFGNAVNNRLRVKGLLFERGVPRLFGTLNQDPNFAAMMLMLYLFYFLFHLNKKKNYVGFLLSTLCIVMTFSRSAFISIIVALLIILGKVKLSRLKMDRGRINKLICGLGIVVVLGYFLMRGKLNFDVYSIFINRLKNIGNDGGSGRFELWKYGIRGWLEKPILGYGGNQAKQYMELVYGVGKELHNTWLEVLFESGILGIWLLICWMLSVLGRANKLSKMGYIYIEATIIGVMVMLTSLSGLFNENNYLVFALVYRYSTECEMLAYFEEK